MSTMTVDNSFEHTKSFAIRIQLILCQVFNRVLDMSPWHSYIYCALKVLSAAQIMFFILYGVRF